MKEGFTVLTSSPLRKLLLGDAAQLLGFSRSKGKEADDARQRAISGNSSDIQDIITKYNEILRARNAIDYDDQISLACDLLLGDESLLQTYRTKAAHLLVDEYQDINAAQFELIRLLSADSLDGLFVVGDDDQSIYKSEADRPNTYETSKHTSAHHRSSNT